MTETGLMLRAEDISILHAIFRQFPEISEVRVFGSRADGTARPASDLDLAVSAPGMHRHRWAAFVDALEEAPLIYFIDTIRTDTLQDPPLARRIAEQSIPLYPQ